MAHSSPIVVQAIAEQMLLELDVYEQLLGTLSREGWSPDLLEQIAVQADRLYRCGQTLPRIAVTFTEFLITRADLAQGLWWATQPRTALAAEADRLLGEHLAAIEKLRQACRRLQQPPPTPGRSGVGAASVLAELARKERPQ